MKLKTWTHSLENTIYQLEMLRIRKICDYGNPHAKEPKPNNFCDCKYVPDGEFAGDGGEETGCCELRIALAAPRNAQ